MKTLFNAQCGLIYTVAKIFGPKSDLMLNLALDTSASATVISQTRLLAAGYNLADAEDESYITTGSGLISIPKIRIEKITALSNERSNILVLAHNLPPTASVDGVLGLDFFRERVLEIDFKQGFIELE